MTKDAVRLSNHAPHSVAVLASPCFPEPASPFQSTRKSASRQAVPSELKYRAPRGLSKRLHRGKRKLTQLLYTQPILTYSVISGSIREAQSAERARRFNR